MFLENQKSKMGNSNTTSTKNWDFASVTCGWAGMNASAESLAGGADSVGFGGVAASGKQNRAGGTMLGAMGHILQLPESLVLHVFGFFVSKHGLDMDTHHQIQQVCKKFHALVNSRILWYDVPLAGYVDLCRLTESVGIMPTFRRIISNDSNRNKGLNIGAFKFIKVRIETGTEGKCYHAYCRPAQQDYAIKRAKRARDSEEPPEGVTYYMLRELAALKKLNHVGICELVKISLCGNKLYTFFPYVEMNLQQILSQRNDCDVDGVVQYVGLARCHAQNILKQVLDAISYCHSKGIVHRNLKPKHLLISLGTGASLDEQLTNATVKVADFALTRMIGYVNLGRELTTEVITLWYRCPEILLGKRTYDSAVDVWSIGCIYAEMLEGRPLFHGSSEIDQLFQIFRLLGVPSEYTWKEVHTLRNFDASVFPDWDFVRLQSLVPSGNSDDNDLILHFLQCDPALRITAQKALSHRMFRTDGTCSMQSSESSTCGMQSNESSIHTFNLHLDYLLDLEDQVADKNLNIEFPAYYSCMSHTYISHQCRSVLVEWMLKFLSDTTNVCDRTIYFAMSLLDRFFYLVVFNNQQLLRPTKVFSYITGGTKEFSLVSDESISESDLLMIGASCLHIASKCEDVSYLALSFVIQELKNCATYTYNDQSNPANSENNSFVAIEEVLLNVLEFDLYLSNLYDFVVFYSQIMEIEFRVLSRTILLAHYLAELTLFYPEVTCVRTSVLALAIWSYTLQLEKHDHWPHSVEYIQSKLGIDVCSSQFGLIVRYVQTIHSSVNRNHVSFRRYSTTIKQEVACTKALDKVEVLPILTRV